MERKELRIGLCGASGVGKTTLANFISEEMGMSFEQGSARLSLTDLDLEALRSVRGPGNTWDNKNHLDNITNSLIDPMFGLLLQQTILTRRQLCLQGSKDSFVTDRTPIDNLVYFMMQNSVVLNDHYTQGYINQCIGVLDNNFDRIIFIRTKGIGNIEEDGHRIANKSYQHMIDSIFEHIIKTYIIPKLPHITINIIDTYDLNERKQLMKNLFENLSIK